jgi:hypothetical protein
LRAFVFIGDISAISAAEEKPERTCAALDLRGFSAADFQEVLTALLGRDAANLSPAVIARLKGEWEEEHRPWQARDLSARRNVDLWADSV